MEGIARDITERKLAEEALRQNEEQFRLLAEKTSDLVCLHEPDGRYLYISPSCRLMRRPLLGARDAVMLPSPAVGREEALHFYEKRGYERSGYSMRKSLH